MERIGLVQVGGKDVTIVGADIEIGQQAPEFTLQNQAWENVQVLEENKGKVKVLTALPSLATGVCDLETRTFNKLATELDENIKDAIFTAFEVPAVYKGKVSVNKVGKERKVYATA